VKRTIGVVIPAHNAERFIAETLDGVAAQERLPDRVVVVDDGSADSTPLRVREWAERSALPVELLELPNRGPAAARNAGIERLDTDLIALLDSDDIWLPHHLAAAEAAFEQEESLILCFASHQKFDEAGVLMEDFLADKAVNSLPFEERPSGLRILSGDVYRSLLTGSYIPPSTSVFSRAAAARIGFFDPGLRRIEDRDFFLRLARVGPFGYYPTIAARYRVHDNNVSHPKNALVLQRFAVSMLMKLLENADELALTPAEIAATRGAAEREAMSALYGASLAGLRSYAIVLREVLGFGLLRPALDPMHLLRAASRGLWGGVHAGSQAAA
jgi:glycosyltransferase involved in cell wall biosynthesis